MEKIKIIAGVALVSLILSGCAINLKIDKPIQVEHKYIYPEEKPSLEERLANSFTDNRRYIFKALIDTPCFLEESNKDWANLLIQYGKPDIDGFIEWATNGVLYNVSGGQFLSNYFNQVKAYYKVLTDEKE